MNEKVEKVFELLGVEPNEEFYTSYYSDCRYRIDDELSIFKFEPPMSWICADFGIKDLLMGYKTIIKIKKYTEEEKIIAKYLKLIGYQLIAKDSDGGLFAYMDTPVKHHLSGFWSSQSSMGYSITYDMPNIKWEDTEPTNIDEILQYKDA